MTNPARRRNGRRRDGPPLQRACGGVASRRRALATLRTFAGPAENRARLPRSSPAAASVRPETFCGTPWHPAAAWDAVWICPQSVARCKRSPASAPSRPAAPLVATEPGDHGRAWRRSEEHTSELQSQSNLVCRLLLEKKKTSSLSSCPHRLPAATLSTQFR